MGGLIDHSLRTLELDCLPRAIPDDVVVDVSALDVGDTVHVSDIALPEGVELHPPADLSVVSVVAPVAEEEAVAAEAIEGEAAEGAEAAAAGQDAGDGAASDDGDGGNKES